MITTINEDRHFFFILLKYVEDVVALLEEHDLCAVMTKKSIIIYHFTYHL